MVAAAALCAGAELTGRTRRQWSKLVSGSEGPRERGERSRDGDSNPPGVSSARPSAAGRIGSDDEVESGGEVK